jgi:hypothetical protein
MHRTKPSDITKHSATALYRTACLSLHKSLETNGNDDDLMLPVNGAQTLSSALGCDEHRPWQNMLCLHDECHFTTMHAHLHPTASVLKATMPLHPSVQSSAKATPAKATPAKTATHIVHRQ